MTPDLIDRDRIWNEAIEAAAERAGNGFKFPPDQNGNYIEVQPAWPDMIRAIRELRREE